MTLPTREAQHVAITKTVLSVWCVSVWFVRFGKREAGGFVQCDACVQDVLPARRVLVAEVMVWLGQVVVVEKKY